MQRASPAAATEPQQFVDAVHSGSGRQDLDGYAARREFLPKTGIGPHTAERAASDDEPLRVTVQQPAEILQPKHVALAPPPVLLHPVRGEKYVRADLATVYHQFPEAIPVDTHTRSFVPRRYADKGRKSSHASYRFPSGLGPTRVLGP